MKVFITGGTGFIGSHLVRFLLERRNAEIFALVRDRTRLRWLEGLNIRLLEGDLHSIPALPSDIDYVFHISGLTKTVNLADYYTVNQDGTASLFQALHSYRVHPKKVICLSSLTASGPSGSGRSVKEHDTPWPVSPYGKSKLLGELEALKWKEDFPVIILRPGAVFGPRDKDFLPYFKLVKFGILLTYASGKQLFSLIYVKDLIRAFDLCIQNDLESGEVINVVDPTPYLWEDIGLAAGKALGKNLLRIRAPLPVVFFYALASDVISKTIRKPLTINKHKYNDIKQSGWVADTKKAEELLLFSPRFTLEEAVKETIEWYTEQGWL
jgi:dihydroflavonol-4-reductase